jgi:hypothetical protein
MPFGNSFLNLLFLCWRFYLYSFVSLLFIDRQQNNKLEEKNSIAVGTSLSFLFTLWTGRPIGPLYVCAVCTGQSI